MNLDEQIINKREGKYKRQETFVKMSLKHYNKKCNCIKNGKKCKVEGIIDLNKFNDEEYLKKIYNNGVLDSIYNIMQSITQSLKCCAGRDLEKSIKETLKENNFHDFSEQVFITNNNIIKKKKGNEKGHIVDMLIPAPKKFPLTIEEYVKTGGEIISTKTSLRERVNQDRMYNKFTILSLEKYKGGCEGITSVYIDRNKKGFTKWFNNMLKNK